jgi:hypothetical protein
MGVPGIDEMGDALTVAIQIASLPELRWNEGFIPTPENSPHANP